MTALPTEQTGTKDSGRCRHAAVCKTQAAISSQIRQRLVTLRNIQTGCTWSSSQRMQQMSLPHAHSMTGACICGPLISKAELLLGVLAWVSSAVCLSALFVRIIPHKLSVLQSTPPCFCLELLNTAIIQQSITKLLLCVLHSFTTCQHHHSNLGLTNLSTAPNTVQPLAQRATRCVCTHACGCAALKEISSVCWQKNTVQKLRHGAPVHYSSCLWTHPTAVHTDWLHSCVKTICYANTSTRMLRHQITHDAAETQPTPCHCCPLPLPLPPRLPLPLNPAPCPRPSAPAPPACWC